MEINLSPLTTRIAKQLPDGSWAAGIKPNRIHVFVGRRGSGEFSKMLML